MKAAKSRSEAEHVYRSYVFKMDQLHAMYTACGETNIQCNDANFIFTTAVVKTDDNSTCCLCNQ